MSILRSTPSTTLIRIFFSWRLSYSNLEVRDQYFSRLKAHIEFNQRIYRQCSSTSRIRFRSTNAIVDRTQDYANLALNGNDGHSVLPALDTRRRLD